MGWVALLALLSCLCVARCGALDALPPLGAAAPAGCPVPVLALAPELMQDEDGGVSPAFLPPPFLPSVEERARNGDVATPALVSRQRWDGVASCDPSECGVTTSLCPAGLSCCASSQCALGLACSPAGVCQRM